MKFKESIGVMFYGICIYVYCSTVTGVNTWGSAVFNYTMYICFIGTLIHSVLKWNKNKTHINIDYVNGNIENIAFECLMLFNILFNLKSKYMYRRLELEFNENKIVEIDNFKALINTYDGVEKAMLFMLIAIAIGLALLVIKKIICRYRISSNHILCSNGEIIKLKDIKDIKIEESFWGFSKKIIVILQGGIRTISVSNNSFLKLEKTLESISFNNNLS